MIFHVFAIGALFAFAPIQGIRARPFDQHRVWNRTNSRSLLPASSIERGSTLQQTDPEMGKMGTAGRRRTNCLWVDGCLCPTCRDNAWSTWVSGARPCITEGSPRVSVGWVEGCSVCTGAKNAMKIIASPNGHHDRTIAPVVLHGRASCGGDRACPDGYRPNGTIVGSRARDHDMKLRVARWLSPALPRTAVQ